MRALRGRPGRPADDCLQRRFPLIYNALRETAKFLVYEKKWRPQDIEFTFEGPRPEDLYYLQTRDMETKSRTDVPSFSRTDLETRTPLGHGIGVSGGAMWGRAVFTVDDITAWRRREPATPLILIRRDTVPDDIREISAADGLLTARGGATSHAAIVANRLGKTCVVGCADLVCLEHEGRFELNGTTVEAGDHVSIDGAEGSVYAGRLGMTEETEN